MFLIRTRRSAAVDPVDGHLKSSYLQPIQIAGVFGNQPENYSTAAAEHDRSEPRALCLAAKLKNCSRYANCAAEPRAVAQHLTSRTLIAGLELFDAPRGHG
jgi:hypothetical protein